MGRHQDNYCTNQECCPDDENPLKIASRRAHDEIKKMTTAPPAKLIKINDDLWRPGDGYFPVPDTDPEIEPFAGQKSNNNPAYREYLDKLERVNREHEERRLVRKTNDEK